MPKTSPCAHAKQAHLQAQLRNLTATKLETAKRSSQHSGGAIRPCSNRVHPTLRRPRLADVGLGGTPFNWNFLRLPSGQSIHFLEDFSAVFLAWARPRLPLPSLSFPLQDAMPGDVSRQRAGPQELFPIPHLSSGQEPLRIAPVLKGGSNINWGAGRIRLIDLPRKLFACGEEAVQPFVGPSDICAPVFYRLSTLYRVHLADGRDTRWRAASNKTIPVATLTFSVVIFPGAGMRTRKSHFFLISSCRPFSSPPATMAQRPR